MDPRSGRGAWFTDDLPWVLAVGGEHLVLLHTDPFPRVELARLGPG